jgi:hypothetical protein
MTIQFEPQNISIYTRFVNIHRINIFNNSKILLKIILILWLRSELIFVSNNYFNGYHDRFDTKINSLRFVYIFIACVLKIYILILGLIAI